MAQASSGSVLDLPASVTLRSAADFRGQMLSHLRPGQSLVIKCDALAEADLSLLQLVVACRKSAAQLGMNVSLDRPASGALLQLLMRSGFLSGAADDPDNDDLFWIQGTTHHE
ncbi:MAG TPA: STAS domain-containing protein [Dongiaceae bacterium]|nr:STAS domain-containing protein [Dongiaceae bacterium]